MSSLASCLESTYLKTAAQSGISERENKELIKSLVEEALNYNFKLVMVYPQYIDMVRNILKDKQPRILLGSVIDFPKGEGNLELKLMEANTAIDAGVDELDFVINYNLYKKGNIEEVRHIVKNCTDLCLRHNKVIKWIIEIAALTDAEIQGITCLIKSIVDEYFALQSHTVFIKSSTGFYKRKDGKPIGATEHGIRLIKANSGSLPVKASGGLKTKEDVERMLNLGVTRIGTSSAKEILLGQKLKKEY